MADAQDLKSCSREAVRVQVPPWAPFKGLDMKNIKDQDGCHDCKYVFVFDEYDQGYEYYCTYDAPKRPLCMSVSMDECPDLDNNKKYNEAHDAWNAWSKNRKVNAWSICSNYEKDER